MATSTSEMTTTVPRTGREIERTVRSIAPRVDIYETDTAYVLLADMPGVPPDGLDVVAERNLLTIRGRAESPEDEPEYEEFELGDYYRAFTLTDDLETDNVKATLRDGVLRVDIPKSPRVQPKKIPVRTE